MSTREVEDIVRQSYVDELDTVPMPPNLLSRVVSIPDAAARRSAPDIRRFTLIAAVAILSTVALGLALSMGGALPHPAITTDASRSPAHSVLETPGPASGSLTAVAEPLDGGCGPLPDGVALQFETSAHQPTGADRQTIVRAFDDGTVLSGDRASVRFGEGLHVRRLYESGLAAVAKMISAAELPACQAFPYGPGDGGSLTARMGGANVAISYGGSKAQRVNKASEGELLAIYQLVQRLQDLDGSLPPSSWRDAGWQSYLPDQWRLSMTVDPVSFGGCGLVGEPTSSPLPTGCLSDWADDIVMPDGTPLLSFGTLYPGRRWDSGGYTAPSRCGVVDHTVAEEIANTLGLKPGDQGPYDRVWSNRGEELRVSLVGMLPGDEGCESYVLAPETPGSAPEDVLTDVDTCAVISDGIEADHLDRMLGGYLIGGPGWWKGCVAEESKGDFHVYARGRPTSAADGASYASSLFGDGTESEQIAGRTIFWNSCFGAFPDCTAAAAVVSEPHLVVFSWLGDPTKDDLRAILARVFEQQLIP